MSAGEIAIEVVSARPDAVSRVTLRLPAGATVAVALEAAAPLLGASTVALGSTVGIFGTVVGQDHRLADGDRIELLRPLAADPKEQRRRLARQGRTMGRGSGSSG